MLIGFWPMSLNRSSHDCERLAINTATTPIRKMPSKVQHRRRGVPPRRRSFREHVSDDRYAVNLFTRDPAAAWPLTARVTPVRTPERGSALPDHPTQRV